MTVLYLPGGLQQFFVDHATTDENNDPQGGLQRLETGTALRRTLAE
ncbi:hypothetical protein [Streptomyces althioticus]